EEAWLTVEPTSAVIAPGASTDINYFCSALELEAGDYLGTIDITSNDPDEPLLTFTINLVITPGVGNSDDDLPVATRLIGNYPNPFNPVTTIEFALHQETRVELEIFNMKGQKVITLVSETRSPGKYQVIWQGKDANDNAVASGIYLYRLKTTDHTQVRKMILLR
ncbi:MAG: T9SS type A sorting domain-containing protein, partial [Candidatus Cloacimonetes bacterium]|nr:T9SS type A sorting domain-containing protein [Candidatus Cloacimonadota bacterium]